MTEEERVAEEEGSSLTAVRTRLEREMVQIGMAMDGHRGTAVFLSYRLPNTLVILNFDRPLTLIVKNSKTPRCSISLYKCLQRNDPAEEEHSEMLLVQRHANRDLTPAEVEAMHLRKTRKKAIRDSLREAHER